MDMEKFGEVMRETSVVGLNLSLYELEKIQAKLIAADSRFEELELKQIKDFLDLYNSVFVAVKNYHIKYELNNQPIKKDPSEPEIPSNNKEWHKANRLKSFAPMDEKVKWHIDHVAHCKC